MTPPTHATIDANLTNPALSSVAKPPLQNKVGESNQLLSEDAPLLDSIVAASADVVVNPSKAANPITESIADQTLAVATLPNHRIDTAKRRDLQVQISASAANKPPATTLEGSTSGLTVADKIGIPIDIHASPPLPMISEQLEVKEIPDEVAVEKEISAFPTTKNNSKILDQQNSANQRVSTDDIDTQPSGSIVATSTGVNSSSPESKNVEQSEENCLILRPLSTQQNPPAVDPSSLNLNEDKSQSSPVYKKGISSSVTPVIS
ncbi:OLC1v1012253C1 [Oldenlandia corymbosa var. corymbosa]|uniref:OLC1v1012253C1 n=1 Tax=Oldenlandia corymbosa var. corymbosa TaxID=529605 RepID=A0AAV1DYK4_OLDCO|nr:OLC1v1012253C1 [Oldenlandia corymbosa var. corymbosa]